MLLLSVILLQTALFRSGQAALPKCNEPVTKLRICSLVDNYEVGMPSLVSNQPVNVSNSVTLFSLAELNEDQSSISLTVLLAMVWNDTRLALKSNDPNE